MAVKQAVVVDLGATRFRVALCAETGRLTHRQSELTRATEGREQTLARLRATIRECVVAAGSRVQGIGVAAASAVEAATGTLINPPNLGWKRFEIRSWLEEEFDMPVRVDNDANLGALGEYHFGIGEGVPDLIYITISTGIGGGIISGGRMIAGPYGMGAEVGHIVIDRNGPRCGCGGNGCLEAMASGPAIARQAAARLRLERHGLLYQMAEGQPEHVTAEMVSKAAAEGDPIAKDLLNEAARCLGLGISSLFVVFTPRLVILGGGVSRALYLMLPTLYRTVKKQAIDYLPCPLAIVPSCLGDDVGLLGAAAMLFCSS